MPHQRFNELIDFFYDPGTWRISRTLAGQIMEYVSMSFRLENYFTAEDLRGVVDDDRYRSAVWEHCHSATTIPQWSTDTYVPRFRSCYFVVLHLFSGERRAHDLQSYLEEMVNADHFILQVLSVDVIFDPVNGDLASESNQQKWERFVTSGCVAMIFAGPPCETWSRARVRGGWQARRQETAVHELYGHMKPLMHFLF